MSQPSSSAAEAYALAVDRWVRASYYANLFHIDEDALRFAAVGEALFWGMSVDEQAHPASERADLCLGLRFARNRATHDLLWAVTEEPGAIFPIVLPTRFSHYVWRQVSDLPLPLKGPGSGADGQMNRAAYGRAWEGCHVDQTLRDLKAHFEDVEG